MPPTTLTRRLFVTVVVPVVILPAVLAGQSARLPDTVVLHADIPYADSDNPRQRLDLLVPRARADDAPLPVVAFIHGGAWRAGDKRSGRRRLADLVATGKFAGASIGYRLTNEAIWPAQIHDCKAAIRWLRANAKKRNLDPECIAVWGTSAGGHLVAMLGVSGDVKELEGSIGKNTGVSSRVRCVVDFFGPTDLLSMSSSWSRMDHDAPDSPESRLVGGPLQQTKETARRASPLTYVSKGDAPILIAHGSADPLVPYQQSVVFHRALEKAGVEAVFISMTGGGHGFRSAELDRRVRSFLDRHLVGEKVTISEEPIPVKPRQPRRKGARSGTGKTPRRSAD